MKILKYVVFLSIVVSLVGCSSFSTIAKKNPISENEMDSLVQNSFSSSLMPVTSGKTFYASKIIGFNENRGVVTEYLWLLCENFKYENNKVKSDMGAVFPAALKIKKLNKSYKIVGYNIDKSDEGEKMSEIFPPSILKKIHSNNPLYNEDMGDQDKKLKAKAEAYFENK